ncbi:hypothetical protein JCM8097_008847 [Rhodosporidiobolus ruineniae]
MSSRTATPSLSTGPVRKATTPGKPPPNAWGKPAAPSPSPTPSQPAPAAQAHLPDFSTLVNCPFRVTVAPSGSLPQRDIEGALFAHDPSIVVLSSPSSSAPARRSYHLINISHIKAVHVVSTTPDPSLPSPSAPLPSSSSASPADLSARVDKAVAEDRKARARVGQGVTPEAQALFDALGKTMPVRWAGKQIVVMDEVVVDEPYGSENVKGAKGAADRVERIKRVVEGIRSRMGTPQPV